MDKKQLAQSIVQQTKTLGLSFRQDGNWTIIEPADKVPSQMLLDMQDCEKELSAILFPKKNNNQKEKFPLSDAQKALIVEKYQGGIQDMDMLTKLAWNDQTIDGRHAKGRAVKKFLVENELQYKTLHHERVDKVELTPEMGEQILAEARKGKGHLEIAQIVFPDRQVKKLSREWRAVLNFITAHAPEAAMDRTEGDNTTSYLSPKEPTRVVKKINEAVGINLDPENLNPRYKAYIDKLTVKLGDMRFVRMCNSYASRKDRDLFEQQVVLQCWDKPDLTAEEFNMYLNLCRDIVTGECLSAHISKLNTLFDGMEDASELTQRFSETLKAKTSEFNECQKRISTLIQKLQGDRAKRMENAGKDDSSLVTLFQMAQEENERLNMIRLAEIQKAAIEEEANRLETTDEWMCRIMGVSKEEVI